VQQRQASPTMRNLQPFGRPQESPPCARVAASRSPEYIRHRRMPSGTPARFLEDGGATSLRPPRPKTTTDLNQASEPSELYGTWVGTENPPRRRTTTLHPVAPLRRAPSSYALLITVLPAKRLQACHALPTASGFHTTRKSPRAMGRTTPSLTRQISRGLAPRSLQATDPRSMPVSWATSNSLR